MVDNLTPEQRRKNMMRIRGKDTRPERVVRKLLHALGFRFRLHVPALPGRPDIVLPRYKAVILVHGCFWHRHPGCRWAPSPAVHEDFWEEKFRRNLQRDREVAEQLEELGWRVHVVWSCQTRSSELQALEQSLLAFLRPETSSGAACTVDLRSPRG